MKVPLYTPDFVERGYNNRAAVPEHPQWFVKFAELSAAARDKYRPTLDLRYGPGPKETLDLFLPAGRPRGTFVFIHGGYWRALDKSDHLFVAGPLVEEGMAVAIVNYDLCPLVSIATIVEECRRAVNWVVRDGPAHGANAANVVVGGHSAGGHLAAMMFTLDWRTHGFERAPLAGGVTLSGVHELAPLVQFSFNTDFRLDDAEAARMSPVHLPVHVDVPLLMAVGADETSEFVRQTQLLWDAWPRNRRPRDRAPLVIAGKHHFSVVVEHADPASALTKATLALF
jgi:arylformamidase